MNNNKPPSEATSSEEKMTTKEAMDHLIKELKTDEAYRYSWLANIAVAFQDEWQRVAKESGLPCTIEHIHKISNKAADSFLSLLCMDVQPTSNTPTLETVSTPPTKV